MLLVHCAPQVILFPDNFCLLFIIKFPSHAWKFYLKWEFSRKSVRHVDCACIKVDKGVTNFDFLGLWVSLFYEQWIYDYFTVWFCLIWAYGCSFSAKYFKSIVIFASIQWMLSTSSNLKIKFNLQDKINVLQVHCSISEWVYSS